MEFIFTSKQTGLAKIRTAAPFLLALKNEIIVWAHLNTTCQSCKNLINLKIVQYVQENKLILNISFDMCILYSDIEQLIIYNVFITFVSFPMMHLHVYQWVKFMHFYICIGF